jgi:hypothetical protein
LALTPETGVPVHDLMPDMRMFDKVKDKGAGAWGGFFLGSPQSWPEDDAKVVVRGIEEALANPVHRDLPASAKKSKPKTVVLGDLGEVAVPDEDDEDVPATGDESPAEASEHTEIQARLIRLGRAMGHGVFVARNDRHREWQGTRLGDLPGVVDELPTQFNDATNKVVSLIDVLWLDDNAVAAAFEVEKSTSIYSGLLRMSDLLVMQPNLDIPIFLVAPEERRSKVMTEVNRPTFKAIRPKRPLSQVCRYVSFESLRDGIAKHGDVLAHLQVSWLLSDLSESCELDDA